MIALMLAAAVAFPPPIRAYVARRDACEHYAGEDGYDGPRRRFLNAQIDKLRCVTLDRDRRRLRATYRSPAIRRELRPLYD